MLKLSLILDVVSEVLSRVSKGIRFGALGLSGAGAIYPNALVFLP
jgi:hypothetical protein